MTVEGLLDAPAGRVVFGTGTPGQVDGTDPLPLNVWSHLALTYDGDLLRLYVDGALEASTAVADPSGRTSAPQLSGGSELSIGGDAGSGG